MSKVIKKLTALGAAAMLLAAQPLTAECCPPASACDPCADWSGMCGDWGIGAHALYFTPVACTYNYAVENRSPDVGQRLIARSFANKCNGDWGFRIFGSYAADCNFVKLSYQWLESKSASAEENADIKIRGGTGGPGRVRSHTRLDYQNLDLKIGKLLHRAGGCTFFVFGNGRWVDLSYRRSARKAESPSGLVESTTEKSELEGGALGIGCGAEFDLWCNFGLYGDANLLGVIAERSTKDVRFHTTADTIGGVDYPSDTCITPEANFRLGLNYTYTCGCWTLVGEVGYELDYFWNAAAFPFLTDSDMAGADDEWLLQCQDVGFSGLYFGLSVRF